MGYFSFEKGLGRKNCGIYIYSVSNKKRGLNLSLTKIAAAFCKFNQRET
jgi:hypothetical protein